MQGGEERVVGEAGWGGDVVVEMRGEAVGRVETGDDTRYDAAPVAWKRETGFRGRSQGSW